MEKRHDHSLSQRIDQVAWLGVAEIKWWELNAWYNRERIGRSVWRDLKERFEDAADDPNAQLYIYESDESVVLIHSDRLSKIDDKIGEPEQ